MTDASAIFRYLLALQRWWAVVALTTLLGATAAFATVPDQASQVDPTAPVVDPTVSYRATHILLRARSTPTTAKLEIVQLLSQEGEILQAAADRLDRVDDAATLAAEVEIGIDDSLDTLSITTTQPTAAEAVAVAEGYATAIVEYFDGRSEAEQELQIERAIQQLAGIDSRIKELEDQVASLEGGSVEQRLAQSEMDVLISQYGSLQVNVRDLNLAQVNQPSTFTTLQAPVAISSAATPPTQPVFQAPTDPVPRIALGAFAGLLLGIVLALVIDRLDTRIRTVEDAEEAFGLPVITGVPRREQGRRVEVTPVIEAQGSAVAEAYHALVVALRLSPRWQLHRQAPTVSVGVGSASALPPGFDDVRTIVVTSAGVGEGKSGSVANLAAALAETGSSVIVLDCDFHRPDMHTLLDTGDSPGLRDVLDLPDGDLGPLLHQTSAAGVSLIPAGRPGPAPAGLLAQPQELIRRAQRLADVVLIDTGPLLATNEAASLIPEADAVVVVARSGRTAKRDARATTERLARVQARVSGIVLIGVPLRRRYGYEPIPADLMPNEDARV